MEAPRPKIIVMVIVGIIAIIALVNAAVVWFLTRGASGALQSYVPVILLFGILTPLLSAAAAYIAAVLLKRRYVKLKNVPFDLHDLLTECRAIIAPKAAEKGIILHFYAEPSISKKPLGDPDLLRDALVRLLSNAVKYTNTGMVKLHSTVRNTRKKNITLTFEVKDSGVGITGEHNYKAGDIVAMLGGKLVAESISGVGSKFSFDLTFNTIDVPEGETVVKENITDVFEKPSFEGEVLLCEDSAMNQQIICEHLERVGLKTVVANNGKTGVETVQKRINTGRKPFDLILMDIHMPVMDGLEAAAKILALNTGTPMVAITANIMPNDLEIYKMSGMYDCVGKPFTSPELWRCLNKYFKPVSRQTLAADHFTRVQNRMRRKMIEHFVRDNRNVLAEIKGALDSGDIKTAHRLAHTLKGSAGQLGKFVLQQAAAEIEQYLKDEKNRVTAQQIATLEAELNAALAELTLAEERV